MVQLLIALIGAWTRRLEEADPDAYPKAISAAMVERQRHPDKWLDDKLPIPDFYNPDDWKV